MPKWSRKRKNKDGTFSYTFRVYRGYTAEGERLKPYVQTWKSPANLTERQADKEAERQYLIYEEQCKTGLAGDATRITLSEFIPLYLEQKKNVLAPYTFSAYERVLNTLIMPALGHHKLKDIKPVHIQAFIEQLCTIKKKNRDGTFSEETLSPASIQRYLTILQSVFKLAIKRQIIKENPARSELLDVPKTTAPKVEIFTKQEAAEMLAALENEPLQFQVLIQLAIMTGARRGELVALKFSDIDKESGKITIERAAVKLKGKSPETKPPKDYEIRTVTVSPECIQLIEQLEQEKQREHLRLGSQWVGDEWLFTQWNGEMMNPQTPTKQFSKFLSRHGFRHRKFHSLRHTSATLLLYGGVSLKQVQGRLGHGDIETTNKYLHYLSEADEEAAGVLQSMLIKQTKHTEQEQKQA